MKVLHVDDNPKILEETKEKLDKLIDDLEIDSLSDVEKALENVKNNGYDAIISGFKMEPKSGVEFLQELRGMELDTTFIIFTEEGIDEDTSRILNLGANRYIPKLDESEKYYEILAEALKQETERSKSTAMKEGQRIRFKQLFEESPNAIVLIDENEQIIEANQAFEDMFQYDKKEIKRGYLDDLIVPDEKKEEGEQLTERSFRGNTFRVESVRQRKDGSNIDVLILGYPIQLGPDRSGIFGIYRDITERKKTERQLKEREEKIENLHDIAAKFQTCEEEKEVYKLAVDAADRILNFNICTIDKVEDDKFVVQAASSEIPNGDRVRKIEEGGVDTKTYRQGRSFLIENAAENEQARPISDEYRGALSVPVGDYGVFQAISHDRGYFDEEDLKLAELLISHVVEAIERIRHEKKVESRKEKIEKLHGIAAKLQTCKSEDEIFKVAVDAAEGILELKACSIDIVEDDWVRPKAVSSQLDVERISVENRLEESGIAGKTYKQNESFLIQDAYSEGDAEPVSTDVRAAISVPIEDIGVFQAISDKPNYFDEEDLNLAELLVLNVEEAVDRVRFEKKLEKRKNKIEQLHETANRLQNASSKEDVYDIGIEAANNILDFYVCTFSLRECDNLVVKATTDKGLPIGTHLPLGEGIYTKTLENNESYLVTDIDKEKNSQPTSVEYKSALSVPLDELGVFQAISDKPAYFDEEDLNLAELLISHVVGSLQRIEYEKELRESEERYRAIFENTGTGMVIIDDDWTISLANRRANRLVDYFESSIEGKPMDKFIVKEDQERAKKYHKLRRKDPDAAPNEYDLQIRTKQGDIKHIFVTANLIPGTSKTVASLMDITDQKIAEKKMNWYRTMITRDLKEKVERLDSYLEVLRESDLSSQQEEYIDKIAEVLEEKEQMIKEAKQNDKKKI